MNPAAAGGALALAEKILALLDLGLRSATYKFALLTAIIDLCLERSSSSGPPTSLTTRQLAKKVTELYWPHAVPFEGKDVLRQGGVRAGTQAEILRAIARFRSRHAGSAGELHSRARLLHPNAFEKVLDFVEWKLIEMPIPRLQRFGAEEDRFLYEYRWTESIRQGVISEYQRGKGGSFDNILTLQPCVAEHLITLTGILRPTIRREWTLLVASMNDLPQAGLERFLFGADRVQLQVVRGPLRELQEHRCFYCQEKCRETGDVDHFIPWARYADDSLDNLVVAHRKCNGHKRDFFADVLHLERWLARQKKHDGALQRISSEASWPRDAARSLAVTRAMYSRLPDGVRLWAGGDMLVALDRERIRAVLG